MATGYCNVNRTDRLYDQTYHYSGDRVGEVWHMDVVNDWTRTVIATLEEAPHTKKPHILSSLIWVRHGDFHPYG